MFTLSRIERDLLTQLLRYHVSFLLVGSKAMQLLGAQREAQDLNLLIDQRTENLKKLVEAFAVPPEKTEAFLKQMASPGGVLNVPQQRPYLYRLFTVRDGQNYDEIRQRAVPLQIGDEHLSFASVVDQAAMKIILIREGQLELDRGNHAEDITRLLQDHLRRDVDDLDLLRKL
ncbi:hypothetical protein [Silvimonas iriomotensis]|uniref:Uncharacterized protein n=1 Tax=Silvimonas iriomotensis TaxID=449662 RepID=A0ABQ2PB93_9NEIS|nr:hypothetical protein [Silvimonas iriomotensis]GGP22676.1 hypothetical protein GCM10010970_26760 [Silvimonas iriomotensis]